MPIRVDEITASDWSIKVGDPGNVVEGIEDVDQCIGIILTTIKGSDPHRPLFGCDAWLYLDWPIPDAIPNVIREAVDSLEMWEPRIDIVRVYPQVDGATITVVVEWKFKSDATLQGQTEVTLVAA